MQASFKTNNAYVNGERPSIAAVFALVFSLKTPYQ
jgi:hypothetical protein